MNDFARLGQAHIPILQKWMRDSFAYSAFRQCYFLCHHALPNVLTFPACTMQRKVYIYVWRMQTISQTGYWFVPANQTSRDLNVTVSYPTPLGFRSLYIISVLVSLYFGETKSITRNKFKKLWETCKTIFITLFQWPKDLQNKCTHLYEKRKISRSYVY